MVTMHCTYPDGTTSEARYGVRLDDAIALYDPLFDYDDRSWDEVTEVDFPALEERAHVLARRKAADRVW